MCCSAWVILTRWNIAVRKVLNYTTESVNRVSLAIVWSFMSIHTIFKISSVTHLWNSNEPFLNVVINEQYCFLPVHVKAGMQQRKRGDVSVLRFWSRALTYTTGQSTLVSDTDWAHTQMCKNKLWILWRTSRKALTRWLKHKEIK